MSLKLEGGPTPLKSETQKLKETIENMPKGRYQSKPTLINLRIDLTVVSLGGIMFIT